MRGFVGGEPGKGREVVLCPRCLGYGTWGPWLDERWTPEWAEYICPCCFGLGYEPTGKMNRMGAIIMGWGPLEPSSMSTTWERRPATTPRPFGVAHRPPGTDARPELVWHPDTQDFLTGQVKIRGKDRGPVTFETQREAADFIRAAWWYNADEPHEGVIVRVSRAGCGKWDLKMIRAVPIRQPRPCS